MKRFFVYILCSKRNGTLYIGVTSDLIKRVYEHKSDLADGFTKRYKIYLKNGILSGMIHIVVSVKILDSHSTDCGNDVLIPATCYHYA
ncbi:MAG: GIY-YIG nuclease family protein [Nitrospirae bacterium]|nr:GIY-YIG nuclease family protein [Nitrospirota bacterium]